MANQDFVEGSSTIADFFKFMRERHKIWINRFIYKKPKPWTDDPILREYKFTNVFRQLDKGTIALTEMLKKIEMYPYDCLAEGHNFHHEDDTNYYECEKCMELNDRNIICNIAWYRLFNLAVHAEAGPWYEYEDFEKYIRSKAAKGDQIFTGAHLLRGMEGEDKHDTYLRSAKEFWDDWEVIRDACTPSNSCLTGKMETVFHTLLQFEMVGGFIAYEMACDLRFTELLANASDINSFANIGPGADRGMRRLGLPSSLDTMRALYYLALGEEHYQCIRGIVPETDAYNPLWKAIEEGLDLKNIMSVDSIFIGTMYDDQCEVEYAKNQVKFELREIEHSLCEFDKYERVRLGQGRPRSRYLGV